jgi:drug/metabolite transporter (DMT)-like permease
MKKQSVLRYHILAIFCVLVWGTTFVSTKVLLNHGLTPSSIFFYRFLMAYLLVWFISPKTLFAHSLKDEFIFLLLGLSGGSLYFLTENTALQIAFVNNVALLVCTAPLLTVLLSHWFLKNEKTGKWLIAGSLSAFVGVALVIFNGKFMLQSNPLGDLLSLSAALLWAIYTILLKGLDSKYSIIFITRKVFFYGLLTIIPSLAYSRFNLHFHTLSQPVVLGNLLFLGIVASMLCFVLWNVALKHLGSVRTSNYIYFNPLVTLITSAIFLHEIITPIALMGALLILAGIFLISNKANSKIIQRFKKLKI